MRRSRVEGNVSTTEPNSNLALQGQQVVGIHIQNSTTSQQQDEGLVSIENTPKRDKQYE